jgi:hypothetical protein
VARHVPAEAIMGAIAQAAGYLPVFKPMHVALVLALKVFRGRLPDAVPSLRHLILAAGGPATRRPGQSSSSPATS